MKLFLSFAVLCGANVGYAQSLQKASNSSTYSTLLVQEADMECEKDEMKDVKSSSGEVLAKLCKREYKDCMFEGSCVIQSEKGQKISISFEKYDEQANQSYFSKSACDYGYGFGKVSATHAGLTCLIPYYTASADALEYNLGDVIYVPLLDGVKLPSGEVHDGYVIIGDYSKDYLDSGADHFSFFTGHENARNSKNSLLSLGLTDSSTVFEYRKASPQEAEQTVAKRGFKVLRTFKKKFKAPVNPMLGQ